MLQSRFNRKAPHVSDVRALSLADWAFRGSSCTNYLAENEQPLGEDYGQLDPIARGETEALREAYAARNRNDISGFVILFDPQIERIEPADFPQGGTYRGLDAVQAHISKGRGTWAEGGCEPERFIVAGDRIIVLIHVCVRLRHELEWRDGRVADVYTFRNGKAIQFRTFADATQAFAWVGVKASDAS